MESVPESSNETQVTSSTSPTPTAGAEITQELKDMYKVVSEKIRLSISNQQLTPESFETILVKVVETIEELAEKSNTPLTGTEKRGIAINLTRMLIDDLHAHGQIDDQTYQWMSLALAFMAPLVFRAAKEIWNKLQSVALDIQEHGKSGCCARNFFPKPVKK